MSAAIAGEWYIEVADIEVFDGEHNLTRRVMTANGETLCVKVRVFAGDTRVRTERKLHAMTLARSFVLSPMIHVAASGDVVIEREGHLVWVTDWLVGDQWVEVPRPDAHLCNDLAWVAGGLASL